MGDEPDGGLALTTLGGKYEPFYGFEIAIDNASQVNVVHPRFLRNLKESYISWRRQPADCN